MNCNCNGLCTGHTAPKQILKMYPNAIAVFKDRFGNWGVALVDSHGRASEQSIILN